MERRFLLTNPPSRRVCSSVTRLSRAEVPTSSSDRARGPHSGPKRQVAYQAKLGYSPRCSEATHTAAPSRSTVAGEFSNGRAHGSQLRRGYVLSCIYAQPVCGLYLCPAAGLSPATWGLGSAISSDVCSRAEKRLRVAGLRGNYRLRATCCRQPPLPRWRGVSRNTSRRRRP